VSTDPAKQLTTISEKVQKTVNQIQEKTSIVATVATVASVAGHFLLPLLCFPMLCLIMKILQFSNS